ncbi:Phytochelatin synthase-domain-containing protein [Phlyctochytrium arcticum]|nr:Phytochelatin synthase-domain-containing protein [Phlyctochytrium arcticum]
MNLRYKSFSPSCSPSPYQTTSKSAWLLQLKKAHTGKLIQQQEDTVYLYLRITIQPLGQLQKDRKHKRRQRPRNRKEKTMLVGCGISRATARSKTYAVGRRHSYATRDLYSQASRHHPSVPSLLLPRSHSTTSPLRASLAIHPCPASSVSFAHNVPYAHPQGYIAPPPSSKTRHSQNIQDSNISPSTVTTPATATNTPSVSATPTTTKTFYRRELPSHLHSFTSPTGRALFRESLQSGHAEIYFSLSGNFTMQSEPAFCGLGSLAMVLNALAVDPGKTWKGVWRWYSDDMLECCAPLEQIRERGMTFRELGCLARCNGLSVVAKRADQVSREEFLADLKRVTASQDSHMVVSFSRGTLSQTGDGHFSPIGAYHPEKNQALVLDTARFKYPSYFCDADLLYDAMQPIDKETGLPRGYFILTKGETRPIALCKINNENYNWPSLTKLFCHDLPLAFKMFGSTSTSLSSETSDASTSSLLPTPSLQAIPTSSQLTASDVVRHVLANLPQEYSFLISLEQPGVDLAAGPSDVPATDHHHVQVQKLLNETVRNPMFNIVKEAFASSPALRARFQSAASQEPLDTGTLSLATIFMLACPRETFATLPPAAATPIHSARDRAAMPQLLGAEVERISEQLELVLNTFCTCGKRHRACKNAVPAIKRPIVEGSIPSSSA